MDNIDRKSQKLFTAYRHAH